ncbi:hypothetical protein MFLAVUS_010395 [Mucor flavus]|uniref:Uncharacterized protein n=1 Tax=Mucor flavus TaxID=439312 RepID=A0ABP9ZCP0_9FUNG
MFQRLLRKLFTKRVQHYFFKQRLLFQYPDMTIYTSQRNMLQLFNNLHLPGHFSIIDTNVNMTQRERMGTSATRILSTPNAGGSSIYSEALSIELLSRLLGVDLYKTETELEYYYPEECDNGGSGPLMDYACHYVTREREIILGVSVTRAMAFNRNYTRQDAIALLRKKLNNIIASSSSIVNTKFDRHILHVWTESGKNAALIKRECKKLKGHLNFKDTIVLISIVNTDLVFFNNNHHLLINKVK